MPPTVTGPSSIKPRHVNLFGLGTIILSVGVVTLTIRTLQGSGTGDSCALTSDGSTPVLAGTLVHESPVLAIPTQVRVHGNYLVVIDAGSDSAVHAFHRTDGRFVRSFGRRGKGPGEFTGAWSLAPSRTSPAVVWVYDLPLRRFTPLTLEGEHDTSTPSAMTFGGPAIPLGPLWLTDSTIASLGLYLDGRIALYDSRGQVKTTLFENSRPSAVQPLAEQATLVRHPSLPVFFAANRYQRSIQILDLSTERLNTSPTHRRPKTSAISLDQLAYLDAAATDEHVYALFSGRDGQAFGQRATFGTCIHRFNWDGIDRGSFRLETEVISIAVDDSSKTLYAIRHAPTPAILRYDMSGALDSLSPPPAASPFAEQRPGEARPRSR